MHKLGSLVFCVLSVHLAHGQFSLGGSSDSSGSSYGPRIKLAGPLGSLIGGQGISLNSGLGQVLSSIINTAANSGSSNSGSPLQQLATAASSNYINAIRSLPFGQFGGGNQQNQQHSQYSGPSSHSMYNGLQNPMNFLTPDSNLYGGQPNFDNAHNGGQFGQNGFQHFPAENYFGNQFGGFNNHHQQSSSPMGSSALYGNSGSYNGHVSGHHLDK